MPLLSFDHVNIRTNNLDALIDWYTRILGFRVGPRPDFSFPGAWLYLGDQALVHLVGTTKQHQAGGKVALEHFAFRAAGMRSFCDLLDANDIEYAVKPVPGFPVVQVNLWDPDGNHIHVDFDSAEHKG